MHFIKVHNTVKSKIIGDPPRVDAVWVRADTVLWIGPSEDYDSPMNIIKMKEAQIECDESIDEVLELLEEALHSNV